MKTKCIFLLFLTSLLFNFSALLGQSNWVKLYGDNAKNLLGKTEMIDNAIYAIGSNGIQSPDLSGNFNKYDLNGNLLWSFQLPQTTIFTDFIQVGDAFILVGYTLPFSESVDNFSIICRVENDGTLTWSRRYSFDRREVLSRLELAPEGSATGSPIQLYALGMGVPPFVFNSDDLLLIQFDENGTEISKKRLDNNDDQMIADFLRLNNNNYLCMGQKSSGAQFATINSDISSATYHFLSGASNAALTAAVETNNKIYMVGRTASQGLIVVLDSSGDQVLMGFTIPQISHIIKVSADQDGNLYLFSTGSLSDGIPRSFVHKIAELGDDDNTDLQLIWTKYIDEGEMGYLNVGGSITPSGQLLFQDSRIGHPNSFGDYDFLIGLFDLEMNGDCVSSVDFELSPLNNLSAGSSPFSIVSEDFPSFTDVPLTEYGYESVDISCGFQEAFCYDFNDQNQGSWFSSDASISIQTPGPSGDPNDYYLQTVDQSGPSFIYNSPEFAGDWNQYLGQCFCFDFKIFDDGDNSAALDLTPRIYFFSDYDPNQPVNYGTNPVFGAIFRADFTITEDSSWVRVCAPIDLCDASGTEPSNNDGAWEVLSPGGCTDWANLLSNLTHVWAFVDYTSSPSEVIGFDNICIEDCPDECGEIINEMIDYSCEEVGSTYTYNFQFVNNTEFEVTSAVINAITPTDVVLSSQFFNFYQNPILPGGSSDPVSIQISLNTPLEEALEICFDVIYLTGQEQCCHYQHCIILNPIDPCEFVRIEPTDTEEDCCYEISAVNEFCPDFFTGILIESITPGVVFSSFDDSGSWTATPNADMTTIFWSQGSSTLPLGSLDPMSFCLGGIVSATQIPQMVAVYWVAVDPVTGEELTYCKEMLEFYCEPCLMLDGLVECNTEGEYIYNYSITNNSDHIASLIVFEVHTPNVIFDPPFIATNMNPGDVNTGTINITSADGTPLPPNTIVEFKAVLFDADDWCCHLDDLSILLPECEAQACICGDLEEFLQEVQEGFDSQTNCQADQVLLSATALGSCDQVSWILQNLETGESQVVTTQGNETAQFSFIPEAEYQVTMRVERFSEDGQVCFAELGSYAEMVVFTCNIEGNPFPDSFQIENQALMLYPVPAKDRVRILAPSDGFYKLTIFDANGQKVGDFRENLYQKQPHLLDITDYPSGIFFVHLKDENGQMKQARFVKID